LTWAIRMTEISGVAREKQRSDNEEQKDSALHARNAARFCRLGETAPIHEK